MTDISNSVLQGGAPAWRRRKAHREGEILQAAAELIVEVGADDVSMAEIGKRAGVSEATVYKYYENRHELLAKAMVEALTPNVERLERDVPLISGCEQKLRFFIARSFYDMAERPNIHRTAYGQFRWSSEYRGILRDVHRRFAKLVESIFQSGIDSGEIRADVDVVLAGDMIFGGMQSFGWRKFLGKRKASVDIEQYAAGFARQLLSGMAVDRPAPESVIGRLEDIADRIERALG